MDAVLAVLDAVKAPFEWDQTSWRTCGHRGLRRSLAESDARQHSSNTPLALKGPLTTPVGGGFRSVNVRMREEFGLYANVRPVRTMIPGARYEDIDIVLIRENIEGLYVAFEHFIAIGDDPRAVAISQGVNTRANACGSPDMHLNMHSKAWAKAGHHCP